MLLAEMKKDGEGKHCNGKNWVHHYGHVRFEISTEQTGEQGNKHLYRRTIAQKNYFN